MLLPAIYLIDVEHYRQTYLRFFFSSFIIQPSDTNRMCSNGNRTAIFCKFQTHFIICNHSYICGRSWKQVRGNIFTETPGKMLSHVFTQSGNAKVKPEQSIFPSMEKVLNQFRACLFHHKITHDHVSGRHQYIAPV